MSHWRMSMRWGTAGRDFFPECRERGIAALGYYGPDDEPIVGDCRELTRTAFDGLWRARAPRRTVARNAMRSLAYEVERGDTIYARSSPFIVAKGVVTEGYAYNPHILAGTDCPWEHFVRVDWHDLPKFKVVTTPTRPTLLKLEGNNLTVLQDEEERAVTGSVLRDLEALRLEDGYVEGTLVTRLVSHYERNPELRSAAVALHGTRCQVCGMSFAERYGEIGEGYIEVHHLKPVGEYEGEVVVDPEEDMRVVCSNCHRMLHRGEGGPLTVEELRAVLERHHA